MQRKDSFKTEKYYHVYNRGINGQEIFKEKSDYDRFVTMLYLANSERSFRLDDILNKQHKTLDEVLILDRGSSLLSTGAWSLTPNNFNLLVRQEVDGGISKFIKKLCTGYSMYFNKKYKRSGALFDGLFKSEMLNEKDKDEMEKIFSSIHLKILETEFPDWENKIKEDPDEVISVTPGATY